MLLYTFNTYEYNLCQEINRVVRCDFVRNYQELDRKARAKRYIQVQCYLPFRTILEFGVRRIAGPVQQEGT
jgi:hypothetical protein